jgi:hypothetical protein
MNLMDREIFRHLLLVRLYLPLELRTGIKYPTGLTVILLSLASTQIKMVTTCNSSSVHQEVKELARLR